MTCRVLPLVLLLLVPTRPASADWLFTPFVGSSFGTETSYVILETGVSNSREVVFGGSVALLSRGIFGAEADLAYAPRFFEQDNRAGNITGSTLLTLNGSVIAAVPLSVTRESLRPYVVAGLGVMRATVDDAIGLLPIGDNILGANLGGGAIGLISPRTGFRFEIRHFRSVRNAPNTLTGENSARLSFWRATVGVIVRLTN